MEKTDYGIFIFRKDLRIEDNRGLIKLSKYCQEIIPIFIFDSYQVDKNSKNKNYLSFPALKFLCESVKDLSINFLKLKTKLNIFYGNPIIVLEHIFKYLKSNKKFNNKTFSLGFNEDYTEYSLIRDKKIYEYCMQNNITYLANDDDFTLCSMDLLLREPNIPYKQYGAFNKNISEQKINKTDYSIIKFIKTKLSIKKLLDHEDLNEFWEDNLNANYNSLEIGSRKLALDILSNIKKFNEYDTKRDILSYNTTHLSAYLNFGLISEREFYWELFKKLKNSQLINQIYWRDYYLCILRYLPKANSYSSHIDERYNKLKWTSDIPLKTSKVWKEWNNMMDSKTGFLIIDAAIQELKNTGYMHNRCRMIVGVFSVKYLKINPLCRYIGLNDWFSRHLLDCSTSQNKLNTQWVTELDFPGKKFSPSDAPIAGRPMSISNIMIKKWNPDCSYIKKWLPHLSNIDNKILFAWDTKYDEIIHPKPIFDAKIRYQEWIELCKNI